MNNYRISLPLIRAETVNPTGEVFYNGFAYAFDVFDRHSSYDDVISWCQDHFGPNGPEGDWMIEMHTMATVSIWFRDPAQAMEFKMRWA